MGSLFLPILFPLFFLIYTDVLSLIMVLLVFYLILKDSYAIAGIFSIFSILIRQNNIIWITLFCIFIYLDNNKAKFDIGSTIDYLKKIWVFLLSFLIFIIFVIINKGFAIGEKQAHPTFNLTFGNIFFLLFVFFFIFLPYNIWSFRRIKEYVIKHKWIIIVLLMVFMIYVMTSLLSHPYNTLNLFLRNSILAFMNSTIYIKILCFIPIAYSLLTIISTEFVDKKYYLLYPFTIIILLSSWLIEQRYYIVPFVLFILFRKPDSSRKEDFLTGYLILLSVIFFLFILNTRWFL